MKEITIPSQGLDLSAIYAPAENPKAAIQIIHGMVEHKERYLDFIRYLNEQGYSVIISDNRGHGKSINTEYPLGHIGSPEMMSEDQYAVTKYIKEKHPGQPLYMFGHSMGSLIARQYIMKHDDEIAKLILCGTVAYIPAAFLGAALAKAQKPRGYSKLLWALSNNMSFKEDLSWLSYDEENIERYSKDPLCSFKFTNYANQTLFTMVADLNKVEKYQVKNPKLNIFSISGKDDRTTAGTKSLVKTLDFLKKAGYEVSFKEYDHMKHEILNEKEKELVYKDVVSFYQS